MNGNDPRLAALDERLRRLFASVDTRAGFEVRLAARIAAGARPIADLREQFERRHALVARRLRRAAWSNAISVAGIGVAAFALYWRYEEAIAQWLAGMPAPEANWVVGGTFAFLAALVTPLLLRTRP